MSSQPPFVNKCVYFYIFWFLIFALIDLNLKNFFFMNLDSLWTLKVSWVSIKFHLYHKLNQLRLVITYMCIISINVYKISLLSDV